MWRRQSEVQGSRRWKPEQDGGATLESSKPVAREEELELINGAGDKQPVVTSIRKCALKKGTPIKR
jgi:hypothetical protein